MGIDWLVTGVEREFCLELISKILSHENHETTELDEAQEVGCVILMARQDTTKVLQPGEQPLDSPASLVTAQCPTVLRDRAYPIGAMRGDQFDSVLIEGIVQFVAVIGFVADQS